MSETTIVRENLMTEKGYSSYCSNDIPRGESGGYHNPRTVFIKDQFVCPVCNWRSEFPKEFIDRYKLKWNIQ